MEVLAKAKLKILNVNGIETFAGDFSAVVCTTHNLIPFNVYEHCPDNVAVSWSHLLLLSGWESESLTNIHWELKM